MDKRTILQACLSAAARKYQVPVSQIKDKREPGINMGKNGWLARGAFLWLVKKCGVTQKAGVDFISMNAGNAVKNRTDFLQRSTKEERAALLNSVNSKMAKLLPL